MHMACIGSTADGNTADGSALYGNEVGSLHSVATQRALKSRGTRRHGGARPRFHCLEAEQPGVAADRCLTSHTGTLLLRIAHCRFRSPTDELAFPHHRHAASALYLACLCHSAWIRSTSAVSETLLHPRACMTIKVHFLLASHKLQRNSPSLPRLCLCLDICTADRGIRPDPFDLPWSSAVWKPGIALREEEDEGS